MEEVKGQNLVEFIAVIVADREEKLGPGDFVPWGRVYEIEKNLVNPKNSRYNNNARVKTLFDPNIIEYT